MRANARETNVEYHKTYDAARRAALKRPGLHCYRPKNSIWIQCFLYLKPGVCKEMAMTEDGAVEDGVTWAMEDGELRVNPDPKPDDDDWEEPTPVETAPIPPTSEWPRRDATSKEWQDFMKKYPPVAHSPGRRRPVDPSE